MQYRFLGKSGLKNSVVGFGGWGIGGWGPVDDRAARDALQRAFDLGVNFYDTALGYGGGHSEALIGEVFHHRRDQVIIATKVPTKTFRWPALPHEPVEEVFPADWIVECAEQSLRNLKTDYIDLLQLHAWTPPYVHATAWYEGMARLKEQGKVRAFGVSSNDWDPYGPVGLIESGLIDAVQVIYNIFEQRPAERLLPAALAHNVGIIVRVPFEEGLLTGALKPGYVFPAGDWRAGWLTPERLEIAAVRVEALRANLAEDRPTLAALALKFVLSHPAVTTVIPGMRRAAHVEANCAVSDGKSLPDDVLAALKGHAFVHGWSYPWSQT